MLLIMCLMLAGLPLTVLAGEADLITTRSAFEKALNSAKDGDTLLVGDIDFNLPSTGAVNTAERLNLDKSITIKSGKSDGNAVFTGASFILCGTMISGEVSNFTFENITFDEALDTGALTDEDWQLSYDSLGESISLYPLKNQYAIQCRGNANASFVGCAFKNYMHTYGAAIRAFYGNYTLNPTLEAEHGNNVSCRLNINLTDCDFSSNAVLYGGGAIYVQASNKNVTLNVNDCSFTGNKSGFVYNAIGGGAIYAQNAIVNLTNSSFEGNEANYYYGGEKGTADQCCGGAIFASGKTELTVRNCQFVGNKASEGGGIAVVESTAIIEDCVITDNKAIPETEDKQSMYGLASNQGLGGAIYLNNATRVTIGNSEIRHNYAENALGAIFTYYDLLNDYSMYSVELLFCTIADNTCGTKMTEYIGYGEDRWLWFSYYTDFFDISYLEYYGNLVVDSLYETDIPRSEQPTEENGFNYYGSTAPADWYENGHLLHAPVVPTELVEEKFGERNYYGSFTVGANNHSTIYNFFMDGECRESVTVGSGEMPALPAFEKTGHTLTHWTLDEKEYRHDGTLVVGNATGGIDLHAVFVPNVYTVTFDFGYTTTQVAQTYGTALALPEPPAKEGYTFVGWFTMPGGDGEQLADLSVYDRDDQATYHAFYKLNEIVTSPSTEPTTSPVEPTTSPAESKAPPVEPTPMRYPIVPVVTVTIVTVVVLALIAGGIHFFLARKKKDAESVPEAASPVAEAVTPAETPKIVKTRYTDEEIEQIIRGTAEANLLTDRELDVFRELLKGRKQSEIGYYLGISVPTVKDNAGRIYAKFGVANKSELFNLIDSKLPKDS